MAKHDARFPWAVLGLYGLTGTALLSRHATKDAADRRAQRERRKWCDATRPDRSVVVVDANDEIVGAAAMLRAHEQGFDA